MKFRIDVRKWRIGAARQLRISIHPTVEYRPISDYAIIGDTRSAALISSAGSIDWLCFPRFDSPAVFLRLLDASQGGYCLVQPAGHFESSRFYERDTAVLCTRFQTGSGVLTVTDFMPVRAHEGPGPETHGVGADAPHRLVRLVRCCEGEVDCRIELKVTPDYARAKSKIVRRGEHRYLVLNPHDNLHVQVPAGCSVTGDVISGTLRLRDGQEFALVLTWSEPELDSPEITVKLAHDALKETTEYWREWSRQLDYDGDHAGLVKRSALVLKLLTYEPTGAIIAAPTTSLPEQIGGKRNWDYRYTWLRDSSLTLAALMNLGNFHEAHDFFHFLHRSLPQNAADFRIMYRVDGTEDLTESSLPLSGYRESRPVQVGNGAARQQQLDIYGELLHCMYLYFTHDQLSKRVESFERDFWPTAKTAADFVAGQWSHPGSGIWEMRGKERRFTHSVAMCWVALDRAIKLARRFGIRHDAGPWEIEMRRIMDAVEASGYHEQQRAYVEYLSGQSLDASILRLPVMGVLDPRSERFSNTVDAIERKLVKGGLVYRYSQAETDDGIGGKEGTFTACAFWLVETYVLQGRLEEAERLFDYVVGHANDLGLMSEELDAVTREQLGNFPQGFTHIGLINAACRIAAAKGRGSGLMHRLLSGDAGAGDKAA